MGWGVEGGGGGKQAAGLGVIWFWHSLSSRPANPKDIVYALASTIPSHSLSLISQSCQSVKALHIELTILAIAWTWGWGVGGWGESGQESGKFSAYSSIDPVLTRRGQLVAYRGKPTHTAFVSCTYFLSLWLRWMNKILLKPKPTQCTTARGLFIT